MQPAKGYVHLFFAVPVQAMLGPIPSLSRRTYLDASTNAVALV